MQIDNDERIQSSLKRIANTSLWVFIGVIISKILAYAYRAIIVRQYGLEVYGNFSLGLVIVLGLVVIASLGLFDGIMRFMPMFEGKKDYESARYIYRWVSRVTLAMGTAFGAILFMFSRLIANSVFGNPELEIFLKIFSIAIPITMIGNQYTSLLKAYELTGLYSLSFNIVQNVAKIVFLFIFLKTLNGAWSVSGSYLFGIGIMSIISYILCRKYLSKLFLKSKKKNQDLKKEKNEIINYSLPLVGMSMLSLFFYWFDTLSLGYFKDSISVGLYNVAIPVATMISIAPEVLTALFFPMINKKYASKDYNSIKEMSKQVTKWIFIVNIPICMIFIIFPGAIINLIFGPYALAAEGALRILSIGALVSSIFLVSNQLINMTGKSKIIFYDSVFVMIINIILNLILVPMEKIITLSNSDGTLGAAIASTVSIVILNLLFFFQSIKYSKIISIRRKMINVLLSAIIALSLLLIVKPYMLSNTTSMVVLVLFYFLVYVASIFMTKSLDKNDFQIIKSFREKIFKNKNE